MITSLGTFGFGVRLRGSEGERLCGGRAQRVRGGAALRLGTVEATTRPENL